MQTPEFAKRLGTGKWVGTGYVLDRCLFCGEQDSLIFSGRGMWACRKCDKGGNTLDNLRTELLKNPALKQFADFADPKPPEGMIVVSDYFPPRQQRVIGTGFGTIDRMIGGLVPGGMTILSGKRGEGKSTILSQTTLNVIDQGHKVGFYSGELSAFRFQQWLFGQAAGARHMEAFVDEFGATRWAVKPEAEKKIRAWLGEKLVLYDNTKVKASERHTIVRRFAESRAFYGCDLFVIDNLMTAKQDTDRDIDAMRAQANFAAEAMDFAREHNIHVILVAHPRKGNDTDINESVAGMGEITNLATNVMQIRRLSEKEQLEEGCNSILTVAKNREHGDTGFSRLNFNKESKRFVPISGSTISRYGWEL